ncbi:PQQ-binding-like beta-propeller repeat protein [bacterium]|nr:PQQ-binding-like beta-propeller repeat protein [bacterium]
MLLTLASCGASRTSIKVDSPGEQNLQPEAGLSSWPASLPEDRLQPWEQLDADGLVVPAERSASGINLESEFIPGVERFSSSGDVTDNGEASQLVSEAEATSQAMYRIPLGGGHPGVVSVDANLLAGKGYYLGLADYGSGRWNWHGPFTDNHVRITTALQGPYTSSLGSLFISVLVSGGSAADVVGIGVNTEDPADTTAPDQPTGLAATALDGGLLLDWDPVIEGELAGYRIYHSSRSFISGSSAGVQHVDSMEGLTQHQLPASEQTYIRISAIDISGNESALSGIISATPISGNAPVLTLAVDKPSGSLAEGISLSASGAESYDFDVDGDGTYDITGDTSGSAQVDTSRLGIIRPRVRATGSEGTAIALGSVSLVISGNSRPVAVAMSDVASGEAPLDVSFSGTDSTDFDGSIVGGGWDFDGDGTYDVWDDTDIVHVTGAANTYMTPGTYNAKLRVVDDQGAWDVDTVAITGSDAPVANMSPTATLQVDTLSGDAPLQVNFSAFGSFDPDGVIVEYAWDWDGDGLYDSFGESTLASHVFTEAGSPQVRLRVEDNAGARATETVVITVNVPGNAMPVAAISVDQDRLLVGQSVSFDASASMDPDGSIVSYEWDFNGDGAWDASGGSPVVSHSYVTQAGYDAVVRVTDNNGAQSTAGTQLAATNTVWSGFGHDTLNSHRSQFRGPQSYNLRWSYDTGAYMQFGAPAIAPDATVYFGSGDDIYAVGPDGSMKWKFATNSSVSSSPAIGADGTIYVGSNDKRVYALSPDGTQKWKFGTGGFIVSGPAIGADGTIYAGSSDNKLYAINPDGTLRWSVVTGGFAFSGAALGTDGAIYFSSVDAHLYAINPDGTTRWSFATTDSIASNPAIGSDGTIYITCQDNRLYAVNPDGSEKWNYLAGSMVFASPAVGADGTVYFGSLNSNLYAINTDGTLAWSYNSGGGIDSTPAIGSDGVIYFGNNGSKLTALNPDGSLLWQQTLGDDITNAPSIGADGTLYVGCSDGLLYAIGANQPQNSVPTADLEADKTTGFAPFTISFDASGSTDSDGEIVLYEWDFDGDGSFEESGSSATASYTYPVYGWYSALVRVTDDQGATDSASLPITLPSEWSMLGGTPRHTGQSMYNGAQSNALNWSYTAGDEIWCSPALAPDGTVYFGCRDNSIYALNPDGSFKWSYATGAVVSRSSPAVGTDGTVYIGSTDDNLYALNPDGSLKWSFAAGGVVVSSPAIGPDGVVYVGSYNNKLYAIYPDGSQKWSFATGGFIASSPAIAEDGTVYFGSADDNLYAVNPDGSGKWSFTTGNIIHAAPAIGADGTIYVGSQDTKLYAILPNGTKDWDFTTGGSINFQAAVASDGTIYVGSSDSKLYAINPNGTEKWNYSTGAGIDCAPAIGLDGIIYVGSKDNSLYAVNPNGNLNWSYATGGQITLGGTAIGSDGTVYFGSADNKLYAVGP